MHTCTHMYVGMYTCTHVRTFTVVCAYICMYAHTTVNVRTLIKVKMFFSKPCTVGDENIFFQAHSVNN